MAEEKVRVAVAGAGGRVGKEIVRGLCKAADLELVAAVDPFFAGRDAGEVAGTDSLGLEVAADLGQALEASGARVLVDFTIPAVAMKNALVALDAGVSPVIGTTGYAAGDLDELHRRCEELSLGAVVAPNFALGAILLMRFAVEAARYFDDVEVIELHHHGKADAPSGTALATAQALAAARTNPAASRTYLEKLEGVRGGDVEGVRVHSVRLPGLVAHQEVIFGGLGQTLTLRHDAPSREAYLPGVFLAVRRVIKLERLVIGLDNLLE